MQLAMLFMGDGVSSPQPVFDLLAPGLKHRSARVKQHCLTILEQIISKCVFFFACVLRQPTATQPPTHTCACAAAAPLPLEVPCL